ncbi:hypothetical protein DQ244_01890 [Blastococcus sp. TBT05-19]|uniref:hypothetical protein n=1 Tax=Blastococcus sp. TBT05-19 TaxID=2250581 RepID=UPI000DEAC927|nr:hypothetical protein [Blastococcus sp. TBT05-19]RBY94137.1 hypothetical protein DQ244_01890 [Blastococcus sp. TBT05-19]
MDAVVVVLVVIAVVLVGAAGLYFHLTRPDSGVMQRQKLTPRAIATLSAIGVVVLLVIQLARGSESPVVVQVLFAVGFGVVLATTFALVESKRRRRSSRR